MLIPLGIPGGIAWAIYDWTYPHRERPNSSPSEAGISRASPEMHVTMPLLVIAFGRGVIGPWH